MGVSAFVFVGIAWGAAACGARDDVGKASCAPTPCPSTATWSDDTCSCVPAIRASDYDQSCVTSDDCVTIVNGELQCGCACLGVAAINKRDEAREETDQRARAPHCDPRSGIECGACDVTRAICTNGQCAVERCASVTCTDDAGVSADARPD